MFVSLVHASIVAKVGNQVITSEELSEAFRAYWREILHLPIARATKQDMKDFLMEYIRAKIVQREAQNMGISVSNSELEEYIRKNIGSERLSPVVKNLVKVEILVNKIVDRISKNLNVTENQIVAYYYLNLRDFKLPAQVLLKRYTTQDLDTANELYYRLSHSMEANLPGVKEGPPMWYSIQALPEIVKRQLYPYQKGSVSKPIDVEGSYLILKIVDVRGAGILPLEAAKPIVRERLLKERRQEVFRQWFSEVLKKYPLEFYSGSF